MPIFRNIFKPVIRVNENPDKLVPVPELGDSSVGNPIYDEVAFLNGHDPLSNSQD